MSSGDFQNLSNADLATLLRENGVKVGPITDTTRLVYERKLGRLQQDASIASAPAEEVEEEEEEEEEEILAGSVYEEKTTERLTSAYQRYTSPLASKISGGNNPPPSYIGTPGQGTSDHSRLNTSLNTSLTRRPLREEVQFTSLRNTQAASSPSAPAPKKKGISIMMKLLFLIVLGLIAWLIYINFESPATKPLLTTNH